MSTLVNVGRYLLIDRFQYAVLPPAVLALSFAINAVVSGVVASGEQHFTGGIIALYVFLAVQGSVGMSQALPFAFSLGVSRRSYYLGALGLGVLVAAVYALGVAALQVVEAATGGWGLQMHFFRVPWVLDGPWPLTWLTAFAFMVLLFAYGMWWGLTYRRWRVLGAVCYLAAQLVLAAGFVVVVTWVGAWSAIGEFLAALSPLGLAGIAALLAAVFGAGGFATIRRLAV
ncbi:ABC transporter permease [Salinifilum ghardaiensis]